MPRRKKCRVCRPPKLDRTGEEVDSDDEQGNDGFQIGPKRPSNPSIQVLNILEYEWIQRNDKVIMYLSQALNRPVEVISSFLYKLTFDNFGRILNPRSSCSCQVPLVDCCTCDLYLGIFDERGDLHNPIRRDCLRKLIQVLRESLQIPKPSQIERVDLFKAIGMKRTKRLRRKLEKQCCYASCSPVVNRKRGLRNLYSIEGKFDPYEIAHLTGKGLNTLGYNFREPAMLGKSRGPCNPYEKDEEDEEEHIDFEKIRKMRASRFKRRTFDNEAIHLSPEIEEDIVLENAEDNEDILPYRHIISKDKYEDTNGPQIAQPKMVVLLPSQHFKK